MPKNTILNEDIESKTITVDPKVVGLMKILVGLATLYTLYFAQSLIIPLVFSALVALLLNPLVFKLKKYSIPRPISAIVLLIFFVAPLSMLLVELTDPAERWVKVLPKLSVEVSKHIDNFSDILEATNKSTEATLSTVHQLNIVAKNDVTDGEDSQVVQQTIKKGSLDIMLTMLVATPLFLAQIIGSMILILFLLIFGPPLFRVIVEDFPIIRNKRKAKFLIKSIQLALSKYIVTISTINLGLGALTAIALAYFDVKDYILWGALVGLFNFVPYIGTMFSLSILLMVGVVQFGLTATALIPSGAFLFLNIIESQIVTPAVLGQRMQVNPLVIILWLLITGWLWGILGVLMAVPLFVCIKLALEQMEIFPHWLKLIEAKDAEPIK